MFPKTTGIWKGDSAVFSVRKQQNSKICTALSSSSEVTENSSFFPSFLWRWEKYKPIRHIKRVEVYPYSFSTSAFDGSEWPDWHPCHFTPNEAHPHYSLHIGLNGSQSQPGRLREEKNLPMLIFTLCITQPAV